MADSGHGVWPFGERHEDDRLSAFLDDELTVDDSMQVARHVAACDECHRRLEGLRVVRQALRALPPVDPPAELYAQFAAHIATMPGGRLASRAWRVAMALAASAALTGAAALAASESQQRASTVAPPVDAYVTDHLARTDVGPLFRPVDLGR